MLSSEQINQYIAQHPEWQRRVMVRLRQIIHSAGSDLEEVWRAKAPHFDVASLPCISLSAGKTCVSVHFAKGAQFKSTRQPYEPSGDDKPSRVVKFKEGDAIHEAGFASLVQKAAALNMKLAGAAGRNSLLEELEGVLKKDPTAWANWKIFNDGNKKAYFEWIADGRREEIRKRRIARSLEMIRDGVTEVEEKDRVEDV